MLQRFSPREPAAEPVVRVRHEVVAVTVMLSLGSDMTCGAARSILAGRASRVTVGCEAPVIT